MSTRSLMNLDPDPQVTRVMGHSELTDLKLADLPTSKLIGSHELLGVVATSNPDASNAEVRLRVMPGQSSYVYATPTSDEVAVILPGDGTAPERHNIVL